MFQGKIPGILGGYRIFCENHKGGPLVFCVGFWGVSQKDPIPLYYHDPQNRNSQKSRADGKLDTADTAERMVHADLSRIA